MSLEQKIETLTAAVVALTEVLGANAAAPAVKDEQKAASKKKAAPKKEEPKEGETSEDKTSDTYYKDVVGPLTKRAAGELGRDVVLSILSDFGKNVTTAKDLEPEQYEEYVDRLNQEIEDAKNVIDEGDDLS